MLLCVLCVGDVQRFKGSDPVEEATQQVKAVKIEEKAKEVKAEVVDEVMAQDVELIRFHFCFAQIYAHMCVVVFFFFF